MQDELRHSNRALLSDSVLPITAKMHRNTNWRVYYVEGISQFSSVQSLSCVWLFVTPWTAARQASCPSPSPRPCLDSCPLSQWCHPSISSSVDPFTSCLQSFPTSGSFQMSQRFASSGQNIGVSASISVLPMNIQNSFPLGWTGWISLQSKGLSRVFSNTYTRCFI